MTNKEVNDFRKLTQRHWLQHWLEFHATDQWQQAEVFDMNPRYMNELHDLDVYHNGNVEGKN